MGSEGDVLTDALRRAFAEGPPLRLAVLFGSAARGRTRPDSDVDVGILPNDPDLPLHAELDLQARLERACGRSVDLVRLDRVSSLLKWEVARSGGAARGRGPS
jgi:predicted nucleotidyltransferase